MVNLVIPVLLTICNNTDTSIINLRPVADHIADSAFVVDRYELRPIHVSHVTAMNIQTVQRVSPILLASGNSENTASTHPRRWGYK